MKLRQKELDFMVNLSFKEIRSRQTKQTIKKYKQKYMFMYTHTQTPIYISTLPTFMANSS